MAGIGFQALKTHVGRIIEPLGGLAFLFLKWDNRFEKEIG